MSHRPQFSPTILSTLTLGALLACMAPGEAKADYFESELREPLVSGNMPNFDIILVHGWHVSGLYAGMNTYSGGIWNTIDEDGTELNRFRFSDGQYGWGYKLIAQYAPWIAALGGANITSNDDVLDYDESPTLPYWSQSFSNGHRIVATSWSSREGNDDDAMDTLLESLEYAIETEGLCQDRGCVIISHSTGSYLTKHVLGRSQIINDHTNVHIAVDSAELGARSAQDGWSQILGWYDTCEYMSVCLESCMEAKYSGLSCNGQDHGSKMLYEMLPSTIDALPETSQQTATLQIASYGDNDVDFQSSCGTTNYNIFSSPYLSCDPHAGLMAGQHVFTSWDSFTNPTQPGSSVGLFSEFAFPFLGTSLGHQYSFEARDNGSVAVGTNFAIWHGRTDGRRYTDVVVDGYVDEDASLIDTILDVTQVPVRLPVTIYEHNDHNDFSLSSSDCAQSLDIPVDFGWVPFVLDETDLCYSQLGSAYPPVSSIRVAEGYRVRLRNVDGQISKWLKGDDASVLLHTALKGGGTADFSWDRIDEIKVQTL